MKGIPEKNMVNLNYFKNVYNKLKHTEEGFPCCIVCLSDVSRSHRHAMQQNVPCCWELSLAF